MTDFLLPDEASRTGGEAAVALFRADDDEGLARPAAGDAYSVFRPLKSAADERSLQDGLHDLARKHRGGGVGAIELEASTRFGVLDGGWLHVVQELSLTHASRGGERHGQQHDRESSSHTRPPSGGCPAREPSQLGPPASVARNARTCEGRLPRPCPCSPGGRWSPISC